MGQPSSKLTTGGTLIGAYAPPLRGADVPTPPKSERIINIRAPNSAKPGMKIAVSIDGEIWHVPIPKGVSGGERFQHKIGAEIKKVIASTLPQVPGMEIVQAKPIVWGSVSKSFSASGYDQQSMGKMVGQLLQDAQAEVLRQAIKAGCNAILGMTFNVTNDSSGERGNRKVVIVTACGTPCLVAPLAQPPTVTASVITPMYNA